MSEDIQLHINGNTYEGWKTVSVTLSMNAPIDNFSLTIVDAWDSTGLPRVKNGSSFSLSLGNDRLATGYLDQSNRSYTGETRSVSLSGRSKAADLQDCSYPIKNASQWSSMRVIDVLNNITRPFGIKVVDTTGLASKVIPLAAIEPGDTPMDVIHRFMGAIGALIMSRPDGNLQIVIASDVRISTPLVLGENIEDAADTSDFRDRFSEYSVVSQQAGNADVFGDTAANVVGTAIDPSMAAIRYRPKVITPDQALNHAQSEGRAKQARNSAAGKSHSTVYTVKGWHHDNGIWMPNKMVNVHDPECGWDDWLLISNVNLLRDEQGQRAAITVMPKSAFDTLPLPDAATANQGAFF